MIEYKTWNKTLSRKVKNSVPETMTINGQVCSNREIIVTCFNPIWAVSSEISKFNFENVVLIMSILVILDEEPQNKLYRN